MRPARRSAVGLCGLWPSDACPVNRFFASRCLPSPSEMAGWRACPALRACLRGFECVAVGLVRQPSFGCARAAASSGPPRRPMKCVYTYVSGSSPGCLAWHGVATCNCKLASLIKPPRAAAAQLKGFSTARRDAPKVPKRGSLFLKKAHVAGAPTSTLSASHRIVRRLRCYQRRKPLKPCEALHQKHQAIVTLWLTDRWDRDRAVLSGTK